MIASLVTTYNRSSALARSLPQIARLGWPVLVVDDGSECDFENESAYGPLRDQGLDVSYLHLPSNRGLAAAMNVGLSYLLADPEVTHVSYAQDDTEFAPDARAVLEDAVVRFSGRYPLLTGHDAGEHEVHLVLPGTFHGRQLKIKQNARATHLLATRAYWESMLPIPTRKLGAPCREPG